MKTADFEVLRDVAMATIFGFLYTGCTLAPPEEYDWTVHVRRRCGLTLTTCLKRLKRAGLLLERDCYHRIYCNFTQHQSECASPVCIPLSPSLKPSIWRPFSVGLSISFFVILCLLLMLLHWQWLAFHPCFYVELYCILLRKCMCNQAFLAFGLINFTSVINGLPLARWQTWGPLFSADFVCESVCLSVSLAGTSTLQC